MSNEKSHWRLQPLNWPNQPSGKTWASHYIQVANRTLWPASVPEANWHHGLCTLRLQRSGTDGPPHPPGLSHPAETETPVMAAGWVNHQQAVGNGGRPVPHLPVPGNMWTEDLSTADRPHKKRKRSFRWESRCTRIIPLSHQKVPWPIENRYGWDLPAARLLSDLCFRRSTTPAGSAFQIFGPHWWSISNSPPEPVLACMGRQAPILRRGWDPSTTLNWFSPPVEGFTQVWPLRCSLSVSLNTHTHTCVSILYIICVCVWVCVCARARARVCVCGEREWEMSD